VYRERETVKFNKVDRKGRTQVRDSVPIIKKEE